MRKSRHNGSRDRRRTTPHRKIGLARAISKLGFCSRAKAAELIRAGRVTLNGRARRDPEIPVHLDADRIEIDGAAVRAAAKVYLMLNKPRNVVTTRADEQGRTTVYDYLPQPREHGLRGGEWIAPVGRLDRASEGLLLFTNDSEWAARLLAPEAHVRKRITCGSRRLPATNC